MALGKSVLVMTVPEIITGKRVVENYTLMSYGIQVHQRETSGKVQ
jgi:hypothetical protein